MTRKSGRAMKWMFLVLMFLTACASRDIYRISDQNLSLGEIKRVVTNVIGDPRMVSQNQRTLYSHYFSRKSDPKFDPMKSKERLYAKVVILGDRRPYDVELSVIAEERDGLTYVESGLDEIEAKKLGKSLRDKLHQGRDERNIIDDFRAF